ncbi:aminotransferase [Planctomycetota bacterium]|nr:aminotransferase [Planctomycetota bacterium]
MPTTSRRVQSFSESVIRRMSRVATKYNAINLAQGFPDFDPPPALRAAAAKAGQDGPHQYAVTWGAPRLRQALAKKASRTTGLPIDADAHLVVTVGSTEAMLAALLAVVDPGDRVLVFSPFYENYGADTILAGAVPVFVPLRPPTHAVDPVALRQAFAEHRPKALILCNPANPTGKVFTRAELTLIGDLAKEYDAFVLTDEVYEHIVYAPHRHLSLATLPGLWERTLTISSLSKTYAITGWRLGYVVAHEKWIGAIRAVHDFLTVGAAAPLQEAVIAGLELPDSYYDELAASYAAKRERFLGHLRAAGLKHLEPEGAYYVLVDVSEFGVDDDVAFAEWLAKEVGVAAVPGSSFYREPVHQYIRFHFAKRLETLDAAGSRLLTLREKAANWRKRAAAAG